MQAQLYSGERPFQDAKNECGMGEYQALGWFAWHHHMTMVMMAMQFMIEQRLHHQLEIPLLSCADISNLLKSLLPRRDVSEAPPAEREASGSPLKGGELVRIAPLGLVSSNC